MPNSKPYIKYIHRDSSIKTLGGFINNSLSIAKDFQSNIQSLLEYDGGTGKNNLDRIFERYSLEESKENDPKPPDQYLLKYNTKLLIPKDRANAQVAYTISNQVINSETFKGFLGDQLVRLMKDKQYRHVAEHQLLQHGTAQDIHYHISVWMWIRQLNGWVDISQFIKQCQSSVTENGGNFQISLPPIVAEYHTDGDIKNEEFIELGNSTIHLKPESISFFQGANLHKEYEASSSFFKIDRDTNELKRNQFYFHNLIQTNDLVYIRYEFLEKEVSDKEDESGEKTKNRKNQVYELGEYNRYISNEYIPGNIFDMIGMVDNNSISFSPQNSELDIQITGRDLMKPLLDDGTYFYPTEFADGAFMYSQEGQPTNFVRRIFGEVKKLSVFLARPLDDSIKFVINLLANTGYVPDDIFKPYGNKRSRFYLNVGNDEIEDKQMRGVWQIIKLIIDENISERRIVDNSIGAQSGSLINFIRKVCEEPFVEFFGDTYGDQYYYIVRQPPFNEVGVKSMLDGSVNTEGVQQQGEISEPTYSFALEVEEKDIIQEQLQFDDQEVYTWFKLNPQGMFFGDSEEVNLAYLPAFYLVEYVEVWGSKPYEKDTNYIDYQPFTTNKKKDIDTNVFNVALKDLKFLVDINAYMPFTRKGQVTINQDRRIKRGTFIRYKPTGEVFYVTGVSHSFMMGDTMEATTTLQLERGMVEDFVWGKNVYVYDEDDKEWVNKEVSYFNIVNTNIRTDKLNSGDAEKILQDWGVNKPIFNFFLNKQQFAYS